MKGAVSPPESSSHRDPVTGARVDQITSRPAISHPSYFLQSSFLPGDESLFFTSYRTGPAHLFMAGFPDGPLRQLTDGPAIHAFSPALHPGGREILFVRGGGLWAIDLSSLAERIVAEIANAQLGEPSISADGEWFVTAFKQAAQAGLFVGRCAGGSAQTIPFPRTVIHPQFHPLDPEWIEFAADPAPRMFRVRRDGSGLECLYKHGNDEFIVHETFLGNTGDLVFTVWPFRVCRMDWTTRQMRVIIEHNAWHIAPNRSGDKILCDTNHPDRGIEIIDVVTGGLRSVCRSDATNQGSQWKTSRYALPEDFAAASSAAKTGGNLSWMETAADTVYGPQWTHPHPSWSSNEQKIAFASDRTGTTQVYVVYSSQTEG
jgi:oligogalacturonide lyase